MIGDVLLDCAWAGETLAGFENHAGRTILGRGRGAARPGRRRLRQRRRSPASRAAGSGASTAPTFTARCCRATRGSPTACSPTRSRTAPAGGRARAARRQPRARGARGRRGAGARARRPLGPAWVDGLLVEPDHVPARVDGRRRRRGRSRASGSRRPTRSVVDVADVRRDLLERPAVPHRALPLLQLLERHAPSPSGPGVPGRPSRLPIQSEPRYTAGSPGRQRWTKRFIGGCRTISSSSSSENSRAPRTAASCVSTSSSERCERSAPKMMWTTWRSPGRPVGRDRLGDRDRALELRGSSQSPSSSPSSRRERLRQRLAAVDAAARQQPVLLAGLLLAAEQHAVLPAQQRRRRGRAAPSVPRRAEAADAPLGLGQLVDLDELDLGHAAGRRAARSASPARRRTSLARSVFSRSTSSSPR